jgi:chemotaxis protein methyltransferase CheR
MSKHEDPYEVIADLLHKRTGQHIAPSRRWRIETALAGLFRELGISTVDQLACLIEKDDDHELSQRICEALLNNETYFFRDNPYFETLANSVLPSLARARAASRRLSIWSAGCSTGQEALSLAIILSEQASLWSGWTVSILGTDISSRAIEIARRNRYSQFEIQRGMSVGRMLSFFEELGDGWAACDALRTSVRFERANLLSDPPPGAPFDLVLCRNVLLYLEGAARDRAFTQLHKALRQDGLLMMGAGETSLGHTDLFQPAEGLAGFHCRDCTSKLASRAA